MPPTTRPSGRARAVGAAFAAATALALASCSSGTPAVAPDSASTSVGSTTSATPSTVPTSSAPTPTAKPPATTTTTTTTARPGPQPAGAVTLLGGLDVAWSVAPLPDGSALVSERNTGRIYRVPKPGTGGTPKMLGRVPIVRTEGEGGLLGLAVPVDFEVDPVFFAYYSTDDDNRIAAIPYRESGFGTQRVIFSGIPRGRNHNGGRIAFGPDGYLYVGTGEAGDTDLSQNLGSLGGKILRITPDGKPAPGNPFGGSAIWSLGHRNVQGLAWDREGRLWASEFGQNTWDELNVIKPGGNYGWPEVEGKAGNPDFVDPVAVWAPRDMSPSGIAVGPDGAVYLAALRGQSVWRVPVSASGRAGTPQRFLQGRYGRIRDIRFVGGRVWVTTSNNDGRDRLLSLPLSAVGAG